MAVRKEQRIGDEKSYQAAGFTLCERFEGDAGTERHGDELEGLLVIRGWS